MDDPNYQLAVARAVVPEVLLAPDVAVALDIPTEHAQRCVMGGRLGPFFFIDGRPAILRETFLAALAELSADAQEVLP